jgi:hypothetical protein
MRTLLSPLKLAWVSTTTMIYLLKSNSTFATSVRNPKRRAPIRGEGGLISKPFLATSTRALSCSQSETRTKAVQSQGCQTSETEECPDICHSEVISDDFCSDDV